jgi:hypothetical protein
VVSQDEYEQWIDEQRADAQPAGEGDRS